MTRTWLSLGGLSLSGAELFAVAGVWRPTAEWGAAYAMVMTGSEGCAAAEVHERMPVVLAPGDYGRWLEGSPQEALDLCRPWPGSLVIDRTAEPWAKGAAPVTPQQPGLF